MADEVEIEMSPLCRTVESDGMTVRIDIYRSSQSGWILEVVDKKGTSIVWNDQFDSDTLALEEFQRTLEQEGMAAIVESDS